MERSRWVTPLGDPIVQLDCPKCGKRLADVADLGLDLAFVNRSELRSGKSSDRPRPQQVYAEMGSRQFDVGPVASSELWRFKCRCGATPVAHPERLLAKVKEAVSRGEHHLRLD